MIQKKSSDDHGLGGLQLNADNKVHIVRRLVETFEVSNHLRVCRKIFESLANLHR